MGAASELDGLLDAIGDLSVAVYGDFALDAYWEVEEDGETSLETGRAVLLVKQERYAPGGAGNVAANLVALGVGEVLAVGPVGDDASGQRLREDLTARGVDVSGLTAPHAEWSTPTYAKPIRAGRELERLDFGTRQTLEEGHLTQYASALAAAIRNCGGVVLNQQIDPGALPPSMAQRLGALAAERSEVRFLADTRHILSELAGITHQRNVASFGVDLAAADLEAQALRAAGGGVLFVTLGARGILVADAGRAQRVEAVSVEGPVDPVGAGDTAAAALLAATATGATPLMAARLATLAATVTVKKLGQTGTATAQEVRELARGLE